MNQKPLIMLIKSRNYLCKPRQVTSPELAK